MSAQRKVRVGSTRKPPLRERLVLLVGCPVLFMLLGEAVQVAWRRLWSERAVIVRRLEIVRREDEKKEAQRAMEVLAT
ncbi:MAG: hypothetical protein HRU14_07665 [Planctomycetes bacterium]|nr:hypothetical protein [Planctomycetota bacterium]